MGRNGVRVTLATLAGSCAVAGGVVLVLPRVLPPDDPMPREGAALAAQPDPRPTPADAADPPPPTTPSFDTVRLDPDGAGLVAGRAEPGASVSVMADGEVAAEAVADETGRFVAFVDVAPTVEPLELSLRDQEGALSEATVVLAPLAEPPLTEVPDPLASGDADTAPDPSDTVERPASEVAAGPQDVQEPSPVAADDITEHGMAATQPRSGPPVMTGTLPVAPPAELQASGQALVLLAEPEGVRVLQPALAPGSGPEVLSSVALDAIAYGGAGEVTLTGRGTAGDLVRLYLDNRPVSDAPIDAEGYWRAELGATESGTYALRIDQVDAAGEVVSRIEMPFQREERAAVAAAMSEAEVTGETIAMRTVQPGNTLWAIARDRYGEPTMYVRVFEANRDRIRDPDLIYPGQVFVLPASPGR